MRWFECLVLGMREWEYEGWGLLVFDLAIEDSGHNYIAHALMATVLNVCGLRPTTEVGSLAGGLCGGAPEQLSLRDRASRIRQAASATGSHGTLQAANSKRCRHSTRPR